MVFPLTLEQIDTANRIHDQLSEWALVDRSLDLLSKSFPEFDLESTLLKAVAVNELYYTNVFAIVRMAKHMSQILIEPGNMEPCLVDRLATVAIKEGKPPRRFVSFASKFAHFFIAADHFPIYDTYALRMIKLHLGVRKDIWKSSGPYTEYAEMFRTLKNQACPKYTNRQLDRYLWIAGQYLAWEKNGKAQINGELLQIFKNQKYQKQLTKIVETKKNE